MRTTTTAQDGTTERSDPEQLRAQQVACYQVDDFGQYFTLSEQLARICPGFARSS